MTTISFTVAAAAGLALSLTACGGNGPGDAGAQQSDSPTEVHMAGQVHARIDSTALIRDALKQPARKQFRPGKTSCVADASVDPAVKAGAQVVVKDANGKTIGTSELDAGVLDPSGKRAPISSPCVFKFGLFVPGGSDFYEVRIGGISQTVSADDLSSAVIDAS